jgi:cytochrome P450
MADGTAGRGRSPATATAPDLAVVAGARQARAVLADPRLVVGSADGALAELRVSALGEVDALYRSLFSLRDGAAHTRLRKVVAPCFTRHAARLMRPRIAALVDRLWTRAAGGASDRAGIPAVFDLVADFADPLPVALAREVMELPAADEPRLLTWAGMLRDQLTPLPDTAPDPDTAHAVAGELVALRAYARQATDAAAGGPLHAVARAADADTIDADEAFGLFVLLLVSGLETLSQALVQAVRHVAADPDRLAEVRSDPARADHLFRLALFTAPSLRMLARRAACPVDVGGRRLPAGGTALVLLPAAVADDAQGRAAERGGVTASGRAAHGPRLAALAYGHGPHVCLGMHHADLVGAELLRLLAARYERVETLPGGRPHRQPPVNGFGYLPVRPVPRSAGRGAGGGRRRREA